MVKESNKLMEVDSQVYTNMETILSVKSIPIQKRMNNAFLSGVLSTINQVSFSDILVSFRDPSFFLSSMYLNALILNYPRWWEKYIS